MPILKFIFPFLLSACAGAAFAQAPDSLAMAGKSLAAQQKFKEASEAFKAAYPRDPSLYTDYFDALLKSKSFRDAEALVKARQAAGSANPAVYAIDLGRVYEADGKQKKAEEQYEYAISAINGDDLLTQQLAQTFASAGKPQYAIRVYEQATALLRNPYLYSGSLSRLYAQAGDLDKAVLTIMEAAPGQPNGLDDSKASLLELLGADAKKTQIAQKAIIKKINQQPENPYFTELLTWLYTLKDDWDGALIQIEALDERNREDGRRLMSFAETATRAKHYDVALQALDAVLAKGSDKPLYAAAAAQKLDAGFFALQENVGWTAVDVAALEQQYEAFATANPQMISSQTTRDYATLEAQYAGRPAKAIALLQTAIDAPGATRPFAGAAKLQLGDYQALAGDIWEASLTYSQVDKAFREDALGEDARFRNARLAYYRGDFEWAQGQLSVLKASTSELIANDALYLSVLITENIPEDSNLVPLRRFAYADMLLYQNKDKEAEALLDSVSTAFPKHPLADDILLLRAKLAQKHRDYTRALSYLESIHTLYAKDVLGDDALYQSAVINAQYLKKPEEAKRLYEQLIIEYPGSTYVQSARMELAVLNGVGGVL